MRIARFRTADGRIRIGEPIDDTTARLLTGDVPGEWQLTDETASIATLLPPVDPPNILAIGRNYRAHAAETGARLPESPLVFAKVTTSLCAPGAPIVLPHSAPEQVDFEAELAVVVGRSARRVPVEAAREYVLGYTCANDVSARDCQKNDKQWSRAKGFDTFCPLGPWLVTADALDPQDLLIRSRLNGVLMQDANTGEMIHSAFELVSYLSHQFTLLDGTVILTGTPAGVGFARTPPVFLRDGDIIEIEIEGIGTLRNPVVRERVDL